MPSAVADRVHVKVKSNKIFGASVATLVKETSVTSHSWYHTSKQRPVYFKELPPVHEIMGLNLDLRRWTENG